MDNKSTNMPSDAPFSNQAHKSGPSGQRGKFFCKGGNKKRYVLLTFLFVLNSRPGSSGQQGKFFHESKNNKRKTGPPATSTPNSTASTATSTRATTDGSTPSKTTQSKILFGPHEIDTTVTTDPLITDQWICDTRAAHPTTDGKKIVVGLDCEWKPNRVRHQDNKIALLQLCIGNRCLILQLIYMDPVPDSLKAFLLDEMITFVGVGVGEDLAKLKGHYGLKCTNSVDLQKPCNAFLGIKMKKCMGLKGYAQEILGFELDKSKRATQSNWEQWNLKEMQIRYACLDAFISCLLGCKVLEAKSD
ncbi:Werner Syndrome-like exonuclease [Carex littledalei]|uniref:Werner Syndrome-like exonuclease n=1 Tax=Carex littledalei TaxID=544730 RepID=A0A833R7W6_9POAL|nr:Werner Syndrome-like exonuclease [Carex littledalei]